MFHYITVFSTDMNQIKSIGCFCIYQARICRFLKELYRELSPLSRTERLKCMNEYDEIIMDRVENGQSEETIVRELGDVKKIAYGLLAEYAEGARSDRKKALSQFNKTYMLLDVCLRTVRNYSTFLNCVLFEQTLYRRNLFKDPCRF